MVIDKFADSFVCVCMSVCMLKVHRQQCADQADPDSFIFLPFLIHPLSVPRFAVRHILQLFDSTFALPFSISISGSLFRPSPAL